MAKAVPFPFQDGTPRATNPHPVNVQPAEPALDAEIIVVGAGFSGIGMGVELKKSGRESFIVLERASDLGGTWRENSYPGCACDIPSVLYSFSFEPNHRWSRMFPAQSEIWEYLRRTSIKYGVQPHIRFDTEVLEARYDDASATWTVLTNRGTLRSRVLIAGMGPLDKPNVPSLAGMQRFAGPIFHSARWNHDYDLQEKDVAVIGTGASAIQFVPQIAPLARHLTVFQRTAPWIVPKPDGPVSELQRRLRRFPPYVWAIRTFIYLFLEQRAYGFTVDPKQLVRLERMAERHLNHQVTDPGLRRKLTPDYRLGCKRLLISQDYYPALQLPNVQLVTTPIRELRERSVVTEDGAEWPADAIVLGTGFKATEAPAPVRVYGAGGVELSEAWNGGAEAYLGISVAGFPNLFLLVGPNTGLGHNSMIFMIESQIRYVRSALDYMRRSRIDALDVRADVQRDYNDHLQAQMARTVWSTGCRSWYLDKNGKNTTLWPSFTFAYRFLTRRLRPERYRAIAPSAPVAPPQSGRVSSAT